MKDNLQQAKNCLANFSGEESSQQVAMSAQLALAYAVIALVERLDRLTIATSHEGNLTHSLDVEISEAVSIEGSVSIST